MAVYLQFIYHKHIKPKKGEQFDHNDEQCLIWSGILRHCKKTYGISAMIYDMVENEKYPLGKAALITGVTLRSAKLRYANWAKAFKNREKIHNAPDNEEPWPAYDFFYEEWISKQNRINGWDGPPDNAF